MTDWTDTGPPLGTVRWIANRHHKGDMEAAYRSFGMLEEASAEAAARPKPWHSDAVPFRKIKPGRRFRTKSGHVYTVKIMTPPGQRTRRPCAVRRFRRQDLIADLRPSDLVLPL